MARPYLVSVMSGGVSSSLSHSESVSYPLAQEDQSFSRGGLLNKGLYGEAPPRGPTPYPFISYDHF